jgi:hypothetical protein
MRTASRRMLPLLATVVAVAGVASASAEAAKTHVKQTTRIHVTGQQTTITPSAQATAFLSAHSIKVSALGKATLGTNGSLTLPITHGFVTTPRHNGVLYHDGGAEFGNGTRSISLRAFVLVRESDHTVLTAKVGKVRLIVARVVKLTQTITAKQATITGTLKLSAAAARGINSLFGHHVVGAGANIGTLTSTITYG